MTTSTRTRVLRRSLTGLLLASCALLVTTGQAHAAVDTARTDRPEIEAGDLDFGNKDWLGYLSGGIVNYDVVSGTITPWVSGHLFLNNADDTCTRIEVEYHDAAHTELNTWHSPGYCPTDNRKYDLVISDSAYGSPNLDHVIIRIETRGKNEPSTAYRSVGSATEYYSTTR